MKMPRFLFSCSRVRDSRCGFRANNAVTVMGDFEEVELSWWRVLLGIIKLDLEPLEMGACAAGVTENRLLIQSLHCFLPVPGLCGPVMGKKEQNSMRIWRVFVTLWWWDMHGCG